MKFSKTFCFYAHGKDARFISVQKILADFSAFKDRDVELVSVDTNSIVTTKMKNPKDLQNQLLKTIVKIIKRQKWDLVW